MRPEFFSKLREEMIQNLTSTFKETDLFKLYQTGDLANLDPSDPEMVRLPGPPRLQAKCNNNHNAPLTLPRLVAP
jgi:hypothetical protein